MIALSIGLVSVGLVGLYLRKRALKRQRLEALLQAFVDELVDLYGDDGEGSA